MSLRKCSFNTKYLPSGLSRALQLCLARYLSVPCKQSPCQKFAPESRLSWYGLIQVRQCTHFFQRATSIKTSCVTLQNNMRDKYKIGWGMKIHTPIGFVRRISATRRLSLRQNVFFPYHSSPSDRTIPFSAKK